MDDAAQPEKVKESASPVTDFPADEFQAAVALEAQERDFVFASDPLGKPFNREILGIEVVVMTLGQAVNLIHIRSPFLCGGLPTMEDVFRFLWYLSPHFDPKADVRPWRLPLPLRLLSKIPIIERWALSGGRFLNPPTPRQWLAIQIAALPLAVWWRGIREYVDQIFIEAPSADNDDAAGANQSDDTRAETALTSFACDYIDRFAAEYGWIEEYILSTGLPRLFALMRSMEVRAYARWGKRAPLINYRSDRITAQHLNERNKAELKEERAKKFAHIFAHAPAAS